MAQIRNLLNLARKHLPYLIGLAFVIVNVLIDSGNLVIAPHMLDLINAVLAATGLGILHHRQA